MPTYDYKCDVDNKIITIEAKITDTIEPPLCEVCGKETKKIFSPDNLAVRFKGQGFVRNDRRTWGW